MAHRRAGGEGRGGAAADRVVVVHVAWPSFDRMVNMVALTKVIIAAAFRELFQTVGVRD